MGKRTLWLTRTAVLIAVLVGLQFVTKPLGQIVTGSCVNMVLSVAALCGGCWCGLTVSLLSPFFAFLLGIGQTLLPIVPAISIGNMLFSLILWLLCGGPGSGRIVRSRPLYYGGAVCAAAVKFGVLLLLVTQLLIPGLSLPEKQAAAMTVMFTWPQLITAFIGGISGAAAATLINKALAARND